MAFQYRAARGSPAPNSKSSSNLGFDSEALRKPSSHPAAVGLHRTRSPSDGEYAAQRCGHQVLNRPTCVCAFEPTNPEMPMRIGHPTVRPRRRVRR